MIRNNNLLNKLELVEPNDIPEWLPTGAALVFDKFISCHHHFSQPEPSYTEKYKKLLFHSDSRSVWIKLRNQYKNDDEWEIEGVTLGYAIQFSFPAINNRPSSPKSASIWKEELLIALKEAERGAYATPDNYLDWVYSFNEKVLDYLNQANRTKIRYIPYPHEILEMAFEALKDTDFKRGSYSLKPNSPNAERTYFIRSLTSFFLGHTGRPNRSVVADLSSIAFSHEATENQIRRLTTDLTTEEITEHTRHINIWTKDLLN